MEALGVRSAVRSWKTMHFLKLCRPFPRQAPPPPERQAWAWEIKRATGGSGDQLAGEGSSMEATTGNRDTAKEANLKHIEEEEEEEQE